MEEERETKKKRLSLACNVCRRKKIKCDGIKPTCGKCMKFNQECSYTSNVKKRGPRQGHIELLEQRLKKMEELMTASVSGANNNNNDIQSPLNDMNSTAAMPPAPLQSKPQTNIGYSVIQSQTPPSLYTKMPQPSLQQPNTQMFSSGDLPSAELINHLLDLFFKNCGAVVSIVDTEAFRAAAESKVANPFLLYSVLAIAARFSNRPDIVESPLWMSGEKYASKARAMIDQVIEKPSMDNVQGLLILTINEYGCARGPRCWMYTGLATRMSIEIGLNKEKVFEEAPGSVLPLDRWRWYETRRKLFWESFIHDKFASASTGRPPVLDPLDCEIMLPVDYNVLELESGNNFYQASLDQTKLVHYHIVRDERTNAITGIQMNPLDVNLPENKAYLNRIGWDSRIIQQCVILGKVTQLVNRGFKNGDGAHTPYQENSDFDKLDKEVDAWAETLPLQIRNTPANLEKYRSQGSVRSVRSAQYVLGHILHNSLVVLLNRPSLVLADMPGLGQVTQAVQDKVHKSMEKCLAAADNVTVMLKDLCCQIEMIPPFTAYLVYTVATVMVNSSFSMNLIESQKAETALKEYFRFLGEMKVYWAMSDKLYFMIRDLYAVHQKVLDTCQKSQLGSSATTSSTSTTSFHSPRMGHTWNNNTSQSTTTSSPTIVNNNNTFISPYPTSSTIPIRRLPLADMSLTTSDWTNTQNWEDPAAAPVQNNNNTTSSSSGYFSFLNTNGQGRIRSFFTDPSNTSFPVSSFDIWLQQQQQQQQQQQSQQHLQHPQKQ